VNCPITSYEIVASRQGARLASDKRTIANIVGNKLTVKYETKADFAFYVRAKSISG